MSKGDLGSARKEFLRKSREMGETPRRKEEAGNSFLGHQSMEKIELAKKKAAAALAMSVGGVEETGTEETAEEAQERERRQRQQRQVDAAKRRADEAIAARLSMSQSQDFGGAASYFQEGQLVGECGTSQMSMQSDEDESDDNTDVNASGEDDIPSSFFSNFANRVAANGGSTAVSYTYSEADLDQSVGGDGSVDFGHDDTHGDEGNAGAEIRAEEIGGGRGRESMESRLELARARALAEKYTRGGRVGNGGSTEQLGRISYTVTNPRRNGLPPLGGDGTSIGGRHGGAARSKAEMAFAVLASNPELRLSLSQLTPNTKQGAGGAAFALQLASQYLEQAV
jgi:hypothetical protein